MTVEIRIPTFMTENAIVNLKTILFWKSGGQTCENGTGILSIRARISLKQCRYGDVKV